MEILELQRHIWVTFATIRIRHERFRFLEWQVESANWCRQHWVDCWRNRPYRGRLCSHRAVCLARILICCRVSSVQASRWSRWSVRFYGWRSRFRNERSTNRQPECSLPKWNRPIRFDWKTYRSMALKKQQTKTPFRNRINQTPEGKCFGRIYIFWFYSYCKFLISSNRIVVCQQENTTKSRC